ncbi:translation initiation factor IF-2-like [Psammomys obesus]|uniref:translation initiation factor IF-2-like n=1 Tax=Psammomys obesus TaxID=48139 RepID=UPI0024528AAB|nr:translation initiation factor IF-2-like [Psammomys obesus]
MPEPIPGKLPLSPAEGGGHPKLSHQPRSRSPGCSPGPFLPADSGKRPGCGFPEARSGARAPGVTWRESFQLPARLPPRGPGLGARRAGALGGCGSCGCRAGLPQLPPPRQRSGPSPRLARPTPGPHWQRESPPLRVFRKAPSLGAPAGPLPAGAAGLGDPLGRDEPTFRPAPSLHPLPAWSLRGAELPWGRLLPGGPRLNPCGTGPGV